MALGKDYCLVDKLASEKVVELGMNKVDEMVDR
jgi:hypothetical protein